MPTLPPASAGRDAPPEEPDAPDAPDAPGAPDALPDVASDTSRGMMLKCDCLSRDTMSLSTVRSSPVVLAAAARGRSSSRTARQLTPLYVVSQCVRAMIAQAVSKTTSGAAIGVPASETVAAAETGAAQAAADGPTEAAAGAADRWQPPSSARAAGTTTSGVRRVEA